MENLRMMRPGRKKTLLIGGAVSVLAIAIYAAGVLWRASRASTESARELQAASEIRFTTARLDRPPAGGFEWFSTPAVFADAVPFRDALYLCGPAGLFEYDAQGALKRRFRPGLELPPAPLGTLAVGTGSGQPELYITTAGEGLVILGRGGFRQIRPVDPAYRKLTAVLPLSTGQVLLGTEKDGVIVYDGKRIGLFHPSLAKLNVTSLAGDYADLWVGTIDRGVLHFHAGQLDAFGSSDGLPDPQVLSLAVDGGRAFAGTPVGVAEFDGGKYVRTLAAGTFARTLFVRGDTLLVGTLEQGVVPVPLHTAAARPLVRQPELPAVRIERIFQMGANLYAVARDGVYSLGTDGSAWQPMLQSGTALLADAHVSALAADAAGRLWVGYFDRGLDVIDSGFAHATHIENDAVFCVNRIALDRQGRRTAVATANGLVLFDAAARPRQTLTRRDGLIANHVTDVELRDDGMLIATPAGLTIVDSTGTRSLNAFHGLVNNHVYAIASEGPTILAGTLGGLSIFENGVVKASYTTSNSRLKHHWITALARVGDEWFAGTYGAGIERLDSTGQWRSFPDANDAGVINPNAMLVTENRVYAGTLDHGLYAYDRRGGRWTPVSNGLPSRNVTALAARDGYIHIGTDNGLVRIPERNLENR
jgi:ligand-binding sensor domain-containing protein